MEQNSILSLKQTAILDAFIEEPYLTNNFYFTGGTALSEMYFHHRESEDLDFFNSQQVDPQKLFSIIEAWSQRYSFTFRLQFVDPTYIYFFRFADNEELKIDFAPYPYKELAKKTFYRRQIRVDSLLDIGVNKLVTLTQRAEAKDYVDLFYILQQFTFWDLREGAKAKFNIEIEPFSIAADFVAAEDIKFLPKMLTRLTLDEIKSFFLNQAKKLGQDTLE